MDTGKPWKLRCAQAGLWPEPKQTHTKAASPKESRPLGGRGLRAKHPCAKSNLFGCAASHHVLGMPLQAR